LKERQRASSSFSLSCTRVAQGQHTPGHISWSRRAPAPPLRPPYAILRPWNASTQSQHRPLRQPQGPSGVPEAASRASHACCNSRGAENGNMVEMVYIRMPVITPFRTLHVRHKPFQQRGTDHHARAPVSAHDHQQRVRSGAEELQRRRSRDRHVRTRSARFLRGRVEVRGAREAGQSRRSCPHRYAQRTGLSVTATPTLAAWSCPLTP
jgi:hypothetical protein